MHVLAKKTESPGLPLAKRSTIFDSRLSQELSKWAESNNRIGGSPIKGLRGTASQISMNAHHSVDRKAPDTYSAMKRDDTK